MARFINIAGKKFGVVTAISVDHTKGGRSYWKCSCECGEEFVTAGTCLRLGQTSSCGCLQKRLAGERSREDLKGRRFGKLVVTEPSMRPRMYKNKDQWWLCQCDCGGCTNATACNLKSGGVRSCGCLLYETITKESGVSSFNTLYSRYRIGAKQRSIPFLLTKEEFRTITSKRCYFCNVEPKQVTVIIMRHNGDYLHNGVDRLNPNGGYTKQNSVPCCKTCNFAKGTLTVTEFMEWLERITSFQKSKGNLLAVGERVLGDDI